MVFVEIGAMVVFAGLVSAWTVWVFNNKRGGVKAQDEHGEGTRNLAGTYTTGECSYGLARVQDENSSNDVTSDQQIENESQPEQKNMRGGEEESLGENGDQVLENEEDFEENAENIPSPDVLYWDGEKYTSKEETGEEEKKDQ